MNADFQPVFIRSSEYDQYGLPDSAEVPTIDRLVMEASTMIDEHCGRKNSDGYGSLVYSTYTERQILVSDYNILRLSQKPLAPIDATTRSDLIASGTQLQGYYTGFEANTIADQNHPLSALISLSGRYGYRRRGQSHVYPDLNMGMNTLQVASSFGGPPQWTVIDIGMTDVDERTGEIWVPAGLYLAQYTEIVAKYNSGFDPRRLPPTIKNACAMLVRNFLVRGGNTSGITGISGVGRINTMFDKNMIDDNIRDLLKNMKTVRAM